ncbi:MAG TPA: hypothetical protein DD624_02555 [Alphaproteobacteria bacterium]|nr:hypothetical protein [Alphaproteobacteria bacterium]
MKKAIIDVETLEVWDSVTECAEALGISRPAVHQSIIRNGRCGGGKKKPFAGERKLEYFDYWLEAYTVKEKERFTRKNGIFWL